MFAPESATGPGLSGLAPRRPPRYQSPLLTPALTGSSSSGSANSPSQHLVHPGAFSVYMAKAHWSRCVQHHRCHPELTPMTGKDGSGKPTMRLLRPTLQLTNGPWLRRPWPGCARRHAPPCRSSVSSSPHCSARSSRFWAFPLAPTDLWSDPEIHAIFPTRPAESRFQRSALRIWLLDLGSNW